MADVYPNGGEDLDDDVWIPEVTEKGWVILLKDDHVRRQPRIRDALVEAGARVFCITNGNLSGEEQARWLVNNRHRIARRAQHPGPYVYGVYENRIELLFPSEANS